MRIIRKAVSGTAGARTHVQRAGGCVAYQRPCPVNRNTVAQCRRRGIFANAAREWSKLFSLNQRKVAELAAAERRIDALGHPTRVLPFNYFCRERMRGEQVPPPTAWSFLALNYTWDAYVPETKDYIELECPVSTYEYLLPAFQNEEVSCYIENGEGNGTFAPLDVSVQGITVLPVPGFSIVPPTLSAVYLVSSAGWYYRINLNF